MVVISKSALLDELVKIGEAAPKNNKPDHNPTMDTLKTMVAGSLGSAVGYEAGKFLGNHVKSLQQNPERGRMVKIILPILSGAAVMLADRYRRQLLEKQYKKHRGYKPNEPR